MNEQFAKLAQQAGMEPDELDENEGIIWWLGDGDLMKFAQLVVKECINKIETHRIPVGNSPAGEMACDWTYSALKEIRDEIKEHFGIE